MKNHTVWHIPDMYWPEISNGSDYVSHESICVLNTGTEDAALHITLYYEDRDPIGSIPCRCPAQRTHHIRMDRLVLPEGNSLLRGVPYAAVLISSVPVTVQYTRVDTTQAELGLMTSMAISG